MLVDALRDSEPAVAGIAVNESQRFSGDIFFDTNWANHKSDVSHDLDVIQSIGGTTFRLMFWPEQSGFQLDPKADAISPRYLEMVKNFPEFLAMLSQRVHARDSLLQQ